ncbi:MAG: hypothetical protein ACI31R_02895 [Bacilli bacterium]
MNKEELKKLKELLITYYKQTPRKLKTSITTIGTLDISFIILACYSLLEDNQDFDIIIKSLLASGVTSGILIGLIACQIDIINEKNSKSKKKILKK